MRTTTPPEGQGVARSALGLDSPPARSIQRQTASAKPGLMAANTACGRRKDTVSPPTASSGLFLASAARNRRDAGGTASQQGVHLLSSDLRRSATPQASCQGPSLRLFTSKGNALTWLQLLTVLTDGCDLHLTFHDLTSTTDILNEFIHESGI